MRRWSEETGSAWPTTFPVQCVSKCSFLVNHVVVRHTFVAPQVALLGDTVANQAVQVTLCQLSVDHATVVNNIAGLIDRLALEDRVVGLNDLLLGFLVAFSVADSVPVLVAIESVSKCHE